MREVLKELARVGPRLARAFRKSPELRKFFRALARREGGHPDDDACHDGSGHLVILRELVAGRDVEVDAVNEVLLESRRPTDPWWWRSDGPWREGDSVRLWVGSPREVVLRAIFEADERAALCVAGGLDRTRLERELEALGLDLRDRRVEGRPVSDLYTVSGWSPSWVLARSARLPEEPSPRLAAETVTAWAARAVLPTPAWWPAELRQPVRELYAGEPLGILMSKLDRPRFERSWDRLVRAAQQAGYGAILLGDGVLHAFLARPEQPLQEIRQAAEQMDLSDLDALSPAREGAQIGRMHTLMDLGGQGSMWVALVPEPWMAPAALAWFSEAGEGTPEPSRAAAVARRWQERYGARLALVQPATLAFEVDPSADLNQLAAEAIAFAPEEHDGGADGLLAELRSGSVLRCWWD